MKTYKKGISLIVLVITIIILAILASAVIVTLSNANIIGQANAAAVRADFKGFQEELEVYIANKMLTSWKDDGVIYDRSNLNIAASNATIYEIIPSLENSKYAGFVSIIAGELAVEDGAPNEDIIKDLLASGALSDIPSPGWKIEGNSLVLITESQAVKGYDIYMDGELVDSVTATGSETRYDLTNLTLTTEQISVVAKATYGSSAAKVIAVGIQLNVKSTENGTVTVKGQSGLTEYSEYEVNNSSAIQISATAASGYEFAYWKRVTADGVEVYLSTSATLEVTPYGTEVHFEPVFISSGSSTKLYIDCNNNICGTGDTVPNVPTRAGYDVGDWGVYTSTTNVTVYQPTYTRIDGTDIVTIHYFNGTTESLVYSYNTQLNVQATANNTKWLIQLEGKEKVVYSYLSRFTIGLSFVGDVTIIEVPMQEAVTNIILGMQSVYLPEEAKIRFVGSFELVEGATLVERGVLMTNDAALADNMTRESNGIILGKITAPTENASKVFIINKSRVTAGDTWYGRPYVQYTLNGLTYTEYADVMIQKAE